MHVYEKVLQRNRDTVPLILLALLSALSTTPCARQPKFHSRAELHKMQEMLPLPSYLSPVLSFPWLCLGLSVVMGDPLANLFVCKTSEDM